MKKLFPFVALFFPVIIFAQNFNVALIPDSLKEGANAIERVEELRVIIKSNGKATIKHKYAITVLNEAGDMFAYYSNSYDKLQSLQDITGYLYDANGKELKKVKKKDIQDVSYDDDMSLMTDNRIKRHAFYYKTYPYTIQYEDEQDYDGIFHLPSWQPMLYEKFAVQESNFIVETPENYKLRYKQFNYTGSPVITKDSKKTNYSWKSTNQKAILFEPSMPRFAEICTSVFIAPSEFEVGGYSGDMSTWLGLGKFVASLNANRDALPDNVKSEIHKLTDVISSKSEKIKLLYEYMQKNTRYISVQMGIGSWQPFDAKYVAAKRYGDCKALSNYMVSILKEAGIGAKYVLIRSGEGKKGLWEDFPAPYFNHAVMCVPDAKDTTWLECTSQTESAGFMGSFTGNRKALMISDDGGFVVNTPNYLAKENTQFRKVTAEINTDGTLIAEVKTTFAGVQQELHHNLIHNYTEEQRKKFLNNYISLPTYTVEKNEYKETKGLIPVIEENLKIVSSNYANITSKRLFVTPNLFNKHSKLSNDKPRKFAIEYDYAYKDVDTIYIKIPAGYVTEAVPKDVVIKNKFGSYSIQFTIGSDLIKVLRVHETVQAVFPASDYQDIVKFSEEMYKADRSRIVMVKKE